MTAGRPGDRRHEHQSAKGKQQTPTVEELIAQVERLEDALRHERSQHKDTAEQLAKLKSSVETDRERALEAARAEGYTAAFKELAVRLAAAEFRAAAAGRLSDPSAAVEYIDLRRFVKEDGEPDTRAIHDAVDKLVAAAAAAEPGHAPTLPQGPRSTAPAERQDWIQAALHPRRD